MTKKMETLKNLLYSPIDDDKKEKIKEIKDKIYVLYGFISSVEDWEHYYIKIADDILILKRDNEKFDVLIKLLKVGQLRNITYILNNNDKIITDVNSEFYSMNTIINSIKTNSYGNTYITDITKTDVDEKKDVAIVLDRNYYLYHKLYNKLNKGKTVNLIMAFDDDKLKIMDVREPTTIFKEITIIGFVNIGNEINELIDFDEIVYKNHERGFRFLISKELNKLEEQCNYKISYVKFHSNYFYQILSYEKIISK